MRRLVLTSLFGLALTQNFSLPAAVPSLGGFHGKAEAMAVEQPVPTKIPDVHSPRQTDPHADGQGTGSMKPATPTAPRPSRHRTTPSD